MSVRYFCDLCDKEVLKATDLQERHVDGYEGKIAVGYVWLGDVCSECAYRLDYAADGAKMRVIKELLQKAVKR